MAEKRSGPGEGARRGKRAAPTIDLTATDVTPPAAEPAPQQAAPEPPQPTSEPPHTESPPAAKPPPRGSIGILGLLAVGAAGSAVTAAVLIGLWFAGFGRVQTTLLAAAPDTKAVDALTQRVGKIEETVAKLPPSDTTLVDRIAAADNAMKALGLALTALNKHSDDVAATAAQARERADAAEKAVAELRASVQDAAKNAGPAISSSELDALQKRLTALDQSAQTAHDELAKATSIEKTTQLALAAAALREAVESGAPFTAEMKQAQALGADNALTPLDPFAATGVPSAQALAQELRTLLPALAKASDVQPSGNFFERLQANASKLVHVRRIDAPAGDDASAVLARLEIDAAKADIAAAVADIGKLPDVSRAGVQAWADRAKAREAGLTAARKFAADAARSLGAR